MSSGTFVLVATEETTVGIADCTSERVTLPVVMRLSTSTTAPLLLFVSADKPFATSTLFSTGSGSFDNSSLIFTIKPPEN
jgi:hypothetical protein